MNRNLILYAFSTLLAAAVPAAASDCQGFLPPNDLKIPVGSVDARGIIETQFNEVITTIEKIYKPVVAAQGRVLQINRLWTDATVNANASQSGNKDVLNMYGGLARHEAVTMDGFALVVCHELGHHLGGAPKKPGYSAWASNEGQSDYYANLKCLRQVFADPAASAFTRTKESDGLAKQECDAAFSAPSDRAVCFRAAMAGKSVAYLFKALRNETVTPAFDTPDANVVTAMFSDHPGTQCRMDTYLQGSLCRKPVAAPLSGTDPAAGACTRSAGFPGGFRPLCWYKPASAAELLPPSLRTFDGDEEFPPAFSALNGAFTW